MTFRTAAAAAVYFWMAINEKIETSAAQMTFRIAAGDAVYSLTADRGALLKGTKKSFFILDGGKTIKCARFVLVMRCF